MNRPPIVCLCGSTRFGDAFREANLQETLAGKIVLSIGCEWYSDQALGLTEADKERLDELHLRKIDLADEVYILNVGGYIGESTMREILYAARHRKALHWLQVPTYELVKKVLDERIKHSIQNLPAPEFPEKLPPRIEQRLADEEGARRLFEESKRSARMDAYHAGDEN